MARKQVKVFSFDWDAGGYGSGVMLIAATSLEEATELAKSESAYWCGGYEELSLKYVGKYTEPIVILSNYYQE